MRPWAEIQPILAQVLELPSEERARRIEAVCGEDMELREEVERILRFESRADRMLDPANGPSPSDESLPFGMPFGPYRIVRKIAQGGMGAVYLAERRDDEFRRTVAIKILRRDTSNADMVRRFRNERQILAAIDHPHIAKLYDGGTSVDGWPFLVMEYIQGKPIDEYCDEKQLTVADRLKLFLEVCSAVQVAHQSLVIHRDLKPANILVTPEGEPKLLDFGIAKLLGPVLSTDAIGATRLGTHPMTPEYASPEQSRGAPVTTASDVYSLGVLLYELLTGRSPYLFPNRDLLEMTRVINEEEPLRPSLAVDRSQSGEQATAKKRAARRGSTVEQLRRALRGDLDNIAIMALRKDPQRRYGLVDALAQDIRRHLERHPVRARPDSPGYRASRFVERHKPGVLMAAVSMAAIVGFSAFTIQARNRAEEEALKANAINGFLQRMLGSANALQGGKHDVTVRQAMDTAASEVGASFRDQPQLEAAVRETIGTTYVTFGEYEAAETELQTAWELRRSVYGDRHPDVAQSLFLLGGLQYQRGDYAGARSLLSEAASLRRELLGDRHPDLARTLHLLGTCSLELGDWEAAERMYREAIDIYQHSQGGPDARLGGVLADLASLFHERGDEETAELIYREALTLARKRENPDLLHTLEFLAVTLIEKGELEEAEQLLAEAKTLLRRLVGEPSLEAARNLGNWAVLRQSQGRLMEAAALYRESLGMFEPILGPHHSEIATQRTAYGECLVMLGDYAAAETQLTQAFADRSGTLGPDHPDTRKTEKVLVRLHEALGKTRNLEAR